MSELARSAASLGPIGLGAITGALLAAALPPHELGFLAWIAFWPLLAACRTGSLATRLLSGSAAGLVFGVGTAAPWLLEAARSHLTASWTSAAALTLAASWIYGGAYIAVLALIYPRLPRPRWLAAPAAWVLLEWVRGRALGGAPWALLGHTQHDSLIAQSAELGGVAIVSFLVMLPAAALAERGSSRRWGLAAAAAALVAAAVFGTLRLRAFPPSEGDPQGVMFTLVSGFHRASDPIHAYAYATSSRRGADVVVWPEGTIPGYLEEEPGARAAIAARAREHVGLLVGGPRYAGSGAGRRYFNAVFLFDPQGDVVLVADKHRLVPVGETSPLPWLHELPRPFTSALAPPELLAIAGLRVGLLICWDVLFDDLARALVRQGADLLVNVSSDRGLGVGAHQLVAFARFRAIETRRWLARASGAGESIVIDPAGRVGVRDDLRIAPDVRRPLTLFVRHGELAPLTAAMLIGLVGLVDFARSGARISGGPRAAGSA